MAPRQNLMFAATLLIGAQASPSEDADIGYDLLVTSAGADVPRTCFKVPQLPASVDGAFFISGPAKFEMGGYHFKSFFDGYGRINRFELRDGEVCFTAKFLNTSYLLAAEKLGRICNGPTFYGVEPKLPSCPWRHPMCFLSGAQLDNNWVNILPVKGEGLMLTDSPIMTRLNYETLTVEAGNYPWADSAAHSGGMLPGFLKKDHAPSVGSAHPLRRPKTDGVYVEIMGEMAILPFEGGSMLAVYNIDTNTMNRSLLAHVPVKGAQYLHSFGVSEHYVVLPLNLKMGMPTSGSLISAFEAGWDGIHVIDLEGKIQVFETDPFFHVHIANTYENETGIVMNLGTYGEIPFSPHAVSKALFVNKTGRDTRGNFTQNVERIHLHLSGPLKGSVTREKISPPGRQTDFFKINDMKNGMPNCIYYAVEWFHDDKAYASMAVMKHDLCANQRTYWNKQYSYPGEPFFIATGNETSSEDDGLLVFVTLDGPRSASDFVILDAKTFKEIQVVQLPTHIPFTAHGQFIPHAAKEAVKAAMEVEDPILAATVDSTFQI